MRTKASLDSRLVIKFWNSKWDCDLNTKIDDNAADVWYVLVEDREIKLGLGPFS